MKKYLIELLELSLPILGGNIGQMLIGLGDVYVAGHYSTNSLAAISVAGAIFMTFIIAGLGLCTGITPVLSNYRGQNKPVKRLFGVTIIYSQILALLFFFVVWGLIPLVYRAGLSPEIIEDVAGYLKISAFSVFPVFLFTSLKEFLQSYEIVIFPNLVMGFAVIINIALNFIFTFGFYIIPRMGTLGLAAASLCVRIFLAVILFIYCINFLKRSVYKNIKNYIKDVIKTGTPIAGAMLVEFFGFNIVAVIVGRFDPLYAACHNIIISVTSLVYMVPFSISNALSVKVGFANGRCNFLDIKRYILAGLCFTLIFALIFAGLLIIFRKNLMGVFSNDINVIQTGASIMLVVACFVTFDAIQGVCMGALKGLKETFLILVIMSSCYLLISIPTGLILAYKFDLILLGFWIGLALALISAAIISGCILIKKCFNLKKKYIPD